MENNEIIEIIAATKNAHKVKELGEMLSLDRIKLKSLSDMGFSGEIEENGSTFEENALIKAETVCKLYGKPSLADDSGLCVDFLSGAPGIYSARYASVGNENATDKDNVNKLLYELKGVPEKDRTAKFVCVLALVFPDGRKITVKGECNGSITFAERGFDGFGYDPVFYYPPLCKTFAEMSEGEKNSVSHRKNAVDLLKKELIDIFNVETTGKD